MGMWVGRWLPAAAAPASVLALAAASAPGEARVETGRCGGPAQRPRCDKPGQRTGLLLPEMTADEKIAMLAADARRVASGCYRLMVGSSSRAIAQTGTPGTRR